MKMVEIDLINITGQPNISVIVDDADYLKMLNYLWDYQRLLKENHELMEMAAAFGYLA